MVMDFGVVQRSHPLVEIQVGRHRHFWQVERRGWLTDAGIYLLDMTDGAGLHQFDSLLEFLAGTLLASNLQDAFVFPYRTNHGEAFGNRISQRFLAIYVFARLARMNCGQGVPVIRSGDLDSIDILPFQHVLVEFILVATLVHSLRGLPFGDAAAETLCLQRIDIATSCHLHAGACSEALEVRQRLLSQADKAQDYAVARRDADSLHLPTG